MIILKVHDSVKKGFPWRTQELVTCHVPQVNRDLASQCCQKLASFLGDSVAQWREHRPWSLSEMESNPSHALNGCGLRSKTRSLLFSFHIWDEDQGPYYPTHKVHVGRVTQHMPSAQHCAWHTGGTRCMLTPSHFFQWSVLPDFIQVKARCSHDTMNWVPPAGGHRNGIVGFKKMTKLPNNDKFI